MFGLIACHPSSEHRTRFFETGKRGVAGWPMAINGGKGSINVTWNPKANVSTLQHSIIAGSEGCREMTHAARSCLMDAETGGASRPCVVVEAQWTESEELKEEMDLHLHVCDRAIFPSACCLIQSGSSKGSSEPFTRSRDAALRVLAY